jgi:uncharacterized RDD family membrane protein YckC
MARDNRALRTAPDGTRDHSASWGSRVIARIVDALIVGVPLLVATVWARRNAVLGRVVVRHDVFGHRVVTHALQWWAGLGLLALGAAYEVVLIGRTGRTPGKAMVGLRVVRLDGVTPCGLATALQRWAVPAGLASTVAQFPVGRLGVLLTLVAGLTDLAVGVGDDRRRMAHDKAAGTRVVAV